MATARRHDCACEVSQARAWLDGQVLEGQAEGSERQVGTARSLQRSDGRTTEVLDPASNAERGASGRRGPVTTAQKWSHVRPLPHSHPPIATERHHTCSCHHRRKTRVMVLGCGAKFHFERRMLRSLPTSNIPVQDIRSTPLARTEIRASEAC